MLKHLYLVIIATFLFGFVTGGVIFLLSNTGGGDAPESTDDFVIIARMYGGCERRGVGACPSYRIAEDGEYTYRTLDAEGEIVQFNDTLPVSLRRELDARIDAVDFEEVYARPFTGTCPAEVDGSGFRYEIEYHGARHTFDSCKYILDEMLFEILRDYFDTLERTHAGA